tara:strand:+ start:379 stop:1212 length:834 start_codon:yes stop_codon:yes gene_type:complete
MIPKKGITLLLLILPFSSFSQYAEKIVSGRPGQANGLFGVGKSIYQVQTGFRFSESNLGNSIVKNTNKTFDNSTLFRVGLFEKTEIRAGIRYNIRDKFKVENSLFPRPISGPAAESENVQNGLSNWNLGIRQKLTNQKGIIPAIGIQGSALFGGLINYETDAIAYQLRLLLQHKIAKKLTLNTNITTVNKTESLNYTFSLSYPISPSLRIIGEMYRVKYFNNLNFKTQIMNNFYLGFGFWISDNLQLDVFGGCGYNGATFRTKFISTGLSYRINRRS